MSVKLSKSLPHKSLRYCTLRIRAWRLFATIPLPTLVERAGSSILKPSVDTIRGILTIYQGWLEGGEAEENMAWILWIIICEFPHYLSWITTHLYFCFFLVKLVCLLSLFLWSSIATSSVSGWLHSMENFSQTRHKAVGNMFDPSLSWPRASKTFEKQNKACFYILDCFCDLHHILPYIVFEKWENMISFSRHKYDSYWRTGW